MKLIPILSLPIIVSIGSLLAADAPAPQAPKAAAPNPAPATPAPVKPVLKIIPGQVIVPTDAMRRIWGELISLDLKTRTLICVVSDTVMGRPDELKIHLRMALRQGWTETELAEAILHLGGYAGLPLVREGLLTARETFQEIRAES